MPVVEINLLAVFVAAIVSMIIGFVWFGPLFGKKWMALSGKPMKDFEKMKESMQALYLQGFIIALITAYVLAHFVDFAEAKTLIDGATAGFWVWLGFSAPISYGSTLWEGKSRQLFVLNTAYHLVNLLIIGAILAVWV